MTKSQLPAITLTCPDGHPFTTRATGGITVRCKTCKKPKRIPVDRPRTVREAASYTAPGSIGDDHQDQDQEADADPAAELADRWRSEAEWSGIIRLAPGRSADECPECEGPLSWEPRRTLTCCPECKSIDVPPAVRDHYARQQAQQAIAAVRQAKTIANPAAERAARARLRTLKDKAVEWAEGWISTLGDPDSYDHVQWRREARDFAATLRGWIPEVKSAATEAELAEIKRTILVEVIRSQPGKELRAEYEASRNRAKQDAEDDYEDEEEDGETELESLSNLISDIDSGVRAIEGIRQRFPSPDAVSAHAVMVSGWLSKLDAVEADFRSATSRAELIKMGERWLPVLRHAYDAATWVESEIAAGRTEIRALSVAAGPLATRSTAAADRTTASRYREYRAGLAAQAAKHGYCESPHHKLAAFLGNSKPPARFCFSGSGGGQWQAAGPKICGNMKCAEWAKGEMSNRGYVTISFGPLA